MKRRGAALLVAASVLLAIVAANLLWPAKPGLPAVELPTPNAYDHYVKVGAQIGQVPNREQAGEEELAQFLHDHADVLRQVREGLSLESCVPLEYERDFLARTIERNGQIRQTARLLLAEATLAGKQGRASDAALNYLDVVQLSRQVSRGGLLVHVTVAAAYEGAAWTALQSLACDLTKEERERFLAKYQSLAYPRESLETVRMRERAVVAATNGAWVTLMNDKSLKTALDKVLARATEQELELEDLRAGVLSRMQGDG